MKFIEKLVLGVKKSVSKMTGKKIRIGSSAVVDDLSFETYLKTKSKNTEAKQ